MVSIPQWWLRKVAVLAAVLMLVTLGMATVKTQEVGVFDAIQRPLHQLITKVDGILAVVKPAPGAVVLSTALANGLAHECSAVNMTEEDLSVAFRLVRRDGTEAVTDTKLISPGTGEQISGGFGTEQRVRCEFSFNGSPSDVRANLWTYNIITDSEVYLDAR